MFITTTEKVDGRQTVECKGLVLENMLFSMSISSGWSGAFSGAGRRVAMEDDMKAAQREVMDGLIRKAESYGANAITGFRLENTNIGERSFYITAYGTAVVIK